MLNATRAALNSDCRQLRAKNRIVRSTQRRAGLSRRQSQLVGIMAGAILFGRCSSAFQPLLCHATKRRIGWTQVSFSAVSSSMGQSNQTASRAMGQSNQTLGPEKSKMNQKKSNAKERRREFIGMAKAVDRGQWNNTYQPGGLSGHDFVAKSGLPDRTKPFVVLGIESSCDDTGAAVVRSDGVILGEALASQQDIHEEWGGVVPGLAMTAHMERIDDVVDSAIRAAGLTSVSEVDAIGVTVGPGLEICLRVGCNKARELAIEHKKPFVGVHHLEAHILMARLGLEDDESTSSSRPSSRVHYGSQNSMEFPFLALLVSGGHCQLLKCLGIGRYSIIGGTIDDSLGEAFDKTARLLGLPVGGGGGPAVEKMALEGDPKAVRLPVPLQKRKHDCDFSYAGLKTAVRIAADKLRMERGLASIDELSHEDKANMAASFQNVAIRHIEQRMERAMGMLEPEGIRTVAVVGGVAANAELRRRLEDICSNRPVPWTMMVPPPRLCTDQGSMSAWAAVERIVVGSSDDPTLQEVFAKYPFSVQ